MTGQRDLEAANRELRERVKQLERQLIRRHASPGRAISVIGEAPLGNQLEAMLVFEPVTIVALDRTGELVHVTARRDVARRLSAFIGHSAFELVHPDSRSDYRHRLDQVLAGEQVEFEVRASEDDTEAGWYRMRLSPWRLNGELVGAIAVSAPIDVERQARIENKRFRAILDKANEEIGRAHV